MTSFTTAWFEIARNIDPLTVPLGANECDFLSGSKGWSNFKLSGPAASVKSECAAIVEKHTPFHFNFDLLVIK